MTPCGHLTCPSYACRFEGVAHWKRIAAAQATGSPPGDVGSNSVNDPTPVAAAPIQRIAAAAGGGSQPVDREQARPGNTVQGSRDHLAQISAVPLAAAPLPAEAVSEFVEDK